MHPTPPANPTWLRLANWAMAASILLSLVVFLTRGVNAWQAAAVAPGLAITSGYEEESIFAVWRAAHGQAMYADPTRLPFASSYFNWLFYASYAVPVKDAANGTDDTAFLRTSRLLTALGALLGTGCLFWLLRQALPHWPLAAGGVATYVFFGPLIGWWAHTVRPDVWALALETTALVVLLLTYRRRPFVAVLASCLLFYGAWSFKQTYFMGLGTAILFLAARRQWWLAILLGVGSAALWTTTFLTLGPAYQESFYATGTTNIFYLSRGFRNLRDLLPKTAPLWLLASACLVRRNPATGPADLPLAADIRLLGLLGLSLSLPLAFATSCKLGALSNYYFTSITMLALFSTGLIATREMPKLILLGFATAAGLQLLGLSGRIGKISLTAQSSALAATWNVWRPEPEPRFSAVTILNQPWLNPGSPPLVLAFNYPLDRRAGRPFEGGGVGGMITAGYFRALLLPAAVKDEYDGGSLKQYVRGDTIHGLTLFRRREPPAK